MSLKYLNTVMENEDSRAIVSDADAIVENVMRETIPFIAAYNQEMVVENMDVFLEDDLALTHESIVEYASNDMQEYISVLSDIASDQSLTNEEKVDILSLSEEAEDGVKGTGWFGVKTVQDYQTFAKNKKRAADKKRIDAMGAKDKANRDYNNSTGAKFKRGSESVSGVIDEKIKDAKGAYGKMSTGQKIGGAVGVAALAGGAYFANKWLKKRKAAAAKKKEDAANAAAEANAKLKDAKKEIKIVDKKKSKLSAA
jgi:hypothetical protein